MNTVINSSVCNSAASATINSSAVKSAGWGAMIMNDGIRRSYSVSKREHPVGNGAGRPIGYGDKIFVRVARMSNPSQILAEFTTTTVSDMTEIYGELRRHTRGAQGLTKLYVRNITRGWSVEQPFKLYAAQRPATSVTRPVRQPAASVQSKYTRKSSESRHVVPESVRLLFDM